MPTKAITPRRKEFILTLLTAAGGQGLTWGDIRAALIEAYGSAPVKRSALYGLLAGQQWYKTVEAKGTVRYYLGKPPKRGKSKAK